MKGSLSSTAEELLREQESRLGVGELMQVRVLLFRAIGDPAHLSVAHERLTIFRDHVGEAYRTSLVEDVPLHAAIVTAWAEHDQSA